MSNDSAGAAPSPVGPRLRLAALTAVGVGVVLLAGAAFVLSYAGIHQIALRAGVAPRPARLYPLIFDAMVVIAGAAAVALRGAGWWARAYAWASLLLLIAAVAAGDALHATNVALPAQPTRAVVAVTPWVLLLLAFGLLLEMLRHFRRVRVAGAPQSQGQAVAAGDVEAGQGATGAQDMTSGLDALLGSREGAPPTEPQESSPPAGPQEGAPPTEPEEGSSPAGPQEGSPPQGPGGSASPETPAARPESTTGAATEHPTAPWGMTANSGQAHSAGS
jgi:Protein of unknown function (DUF2637)